MQRGDSGPVPHQTCRVVARSLSEQVAAGTEISTAAAVRLQSAVTGMAA